MKIKLLLVLLLVALVSVSPSAFARPLYFPLELVKALPVEGPDNMQPSELVLFQGTIFTVSDKHDNIIFQLDLEEDKAVAKEHLKFEIPSEGIRDIRAELKAFSEGKPEAEGPMALDLEGMDIDENGNFYLLCERCFAVIRVTPEGKTDWVSPAFYEQGLKKGLFVTDGAGGEALAFIGKNKLLISAERQPRGLLTMDITNRKKPAVTAYSMNKTSIYHPEERNTDITGFYFDHGDLWCLSRNSETIFRFVYTDDEYWEKDVYSFGHVTNNEDYAYQDMTFGMAEGFTMDGQYIYIVLDNNAIARAQDPEDKRPLLLIFQRPDMPGRLP